MALADNQNPGLPLDSGCNNPSVPWPNGADAGERRLRIVLGFLLIGLTAFTAIAFLTPNISVAVINERLDLIINTGATLGAAAIAALAWARYRVTAEGRAFYQAGAFLTLASVHGAVLLVLVLGRGPELGFSLDDPGPLPALSFVLARFVAAALLLVGGLAAIRRTFLERRRAALLIMAPTILTLALLGRRAACSRPGSHGRDRHRSDRCPPGSAGNANRKYRCAAARGRGTLRGRLRRSLCDQGRFRVKRRGAGALSPCRLSC